MVRQLNRHRSVVAFGETCFWGRLYVAPEHHDGTYSAQQREELRQVVCGRVDRMHPSLEGKKISRQDLADSFDDVFTHADGCDPGDIFSRLCAAVSQLAEATTVVEKTPHHVNSLARISQYFPQAKFVVMARDGYSFLRSYKHQGDRKPDDVRRSFQARYHPIACALIYRKYLDSIATALATYPGRVHLVTTDQLAADSVAILSDVLLFLGEMELTTDVHSTERVNSSFPSDETRVEITPAEVFWLNVFGGRRMKRIGFRTRSAGWCTLQVCYTMVTFFPWLIRNAISLRQATRGSALRYMISWLKTS